MLPYLIPVILYLMWNYHSKAKEFAQTFTTKIHSVRFNLQATAGSVFTKLFFDVVVTINNPTKFAIKATGAQFRIYHNGIFLGAAQSTHEIPILANQETQAGFSVGISLKGVAEQAGPLVADLKAGRQVSFTIQGTIQTSGGDLKINQAVNVL